jgi:hypothetical protein
MIAMEICRAHNKFHKKRISKSKKYEKAKLKKYKKKKLN